MNTKLTAVVISDKDERIMCLLAVFKNQLTHFSKYHRCFHIVGQLLFLFQHPTEVNHNPYFAHNTEGVCRVV